MTIAPEIVGIVLNNIWQGAALAALVWLGLRLARNVNAATRYAVWWLVLAAMLALPLVPRFTKPALRPAGETVRPRAAPPLAFYRQLNPPVAAPQDAAIAIEQRPSADWPGWIAAIWAAASFFRFIQIGRSYLYLRGVKQRAVAGSHPLPAQPRRVQMRLSDEISSPFAVGFLRPAILVPAGLAARLEEDELDCVLLHEAAHIARGDDWANLAGQLLGATLALHPAAAWVLARIGREREMACDDWAVARTGAARGYARSLSRVCELSRAPLRAVLASGALGGRSRVRQRIEIVLAKGREFSPRASQRRLALSAAALLALIGVAAFTPRWITLAQRPQFEVASIKLDKVLHNDMDVTPRRSGDLIIMRNARLGSMIDYAYRLTAAFQLVADQKAQEWWDWYAFDAKAPASTTDDDLRLMFQTFLEDRFKLKVHSETRELAAYSLIVAKGSPKLRAPDPKGVDDVVDGRPFHQRPGKCAGLRGRDGDHFVCASAPVAELVRILMGRLGGPVVDGTGLGGNYDFKLIYDNGNAVKFPDVLPAPPLAEALQADLGLKLEKGKAPVEVLVVDHVEKPGEN